MLRVIKIFKKNSISIYDFTVIEFYLDSRGFVYAERKKQISWSLTFGSVKNLTFAYYSLTHCRSPFKYPYIHTLSIYSHKYTSRSFRPIEFSETTSDVRSLYTRHYVEGRHQITRAHVIEIQVLCVVNIALERNSRHHGGQSTETITATVLCSLYTTCSRQGKPSISIIIIPTAINIIKTIH